MVAEVSEKEKTLEELESECDDLVLTIKNYLLVLGVDYIMVDQVIEDLKSQMYMHADRNVNDLIADLIKLENKIAKIKEKSAKDDESELEQKQY